MACLWLLILISSAVLAQLFVELCYKLEAVSWSVLKVKAEAFSFNWDRLSDGD